MSPEVPWRGLGRYFEYLCDVPFQLRDPPLKAEAGRKSHAVMVEDFEPNLVVVVWVLALDLPKHFTIYLPAANNELSSLTQIRAK